MPEPWTFGERPLRQTTELADVLRRLTGLAMAMEADDPRVDELIATLTEAEQQLAASAPASLAPRVGDRSDGDGRVYLDHARDVGAYDACFPLYAIQVDGDRATGTVTFPLAYEGPPGVVHGGFVAVLFDCVIQHHNCDVGVAGKTTNLDLRFRRPTPLLAPLTFEIERTATGDRIESVARLLADGKVCAEATMKAVAGDRADLPAVGSRQAPS